MGCGLKKEKKENNNEIASLKPLIKFKIIFSNIKIKNIPLKKAKVHFSIANQECFQTQISYNNPNPHWRQTFRSFHESDLETLKLEFFKISVLCAEKNKCFAYVVQNMWEVANGPIHYDLFLESTKANSSRITFDLRMVQMTTLKIQSKQVMCELKDQLMEQAYNFQLKVRSHQVDYYSDFSPNYLNHYLYRQSSIKQYGYIDSKVKLRSESDEFQLVREIFDSSQDDNIQADLKSCYLKKNDQDLILKKSKSNNQLNSMMHLSTNQSQTNKSLNTRRPYSTMGLITKKDLLWEFKVQSINSLNSLYKKIIQSYPLIFMLMNFQVLLLSLFFGEVQNQMKNLIMQVLEKLEIPLYLLTNFSVKMLMFQLNQTGSHSKKQDLQINYGSMVNVLEESKQNSLQQKILSLDKCQEDLEQKKEFKDLLYFISKKINILVLRVQISIKLYKQIMKQMNQQGNQIKRVFNIGRELKLIKLLIKLQKSQVLQLKTRNYMKILKK